ncbi:UNVERIFIED_CONTAM: hypothetical protein FKN15_031453 [Acipenser sinensis]
MDDFDVLNAPQAAAGNGFSEEDPAAAFLAQQESEIAGIENDEGFSILDSGEIPSSLGNLTGDLNQDLNDINDGAVNGDLHEESNGPSDTYAAISQVDRLQSEPESLRKWREEQLERLALLDANSRKQEAEWKEKAKVDLEEWYCRQDEQLEKTKVNNRAKLTSEDRRDKCIVCLCLEHGQEALVDVTLCDFCAPFTKRMLEVGRPIIPENTSSRPLGARYRHALSVRLDPPPRVLCQGRLDELRLISRNLLRLSKLSGQAIGRNLAALVIARRQLWLSQACVLNGEKTALLDAPVTPGHTFCLVVDEML